MQFNRIIHGKAERVLLDLPPEVADLTVTSPPYDDLRHYGSGGFNYIPIISQLHRVTKMGGVVVWVVGDATVNGSETCTAFEQALFFRKVGFNLHDTMIYQKSNCTYPSMNRYYQIFEYMFVFSKGKPKTFNPIRDRANIYPGQRPHGKSRSRDGWSPNRGNAVSGEVGVRYNIWRMITGGGNVTRDKIAYGHPAIFPEVLARDHIRSWSNVGDLVLDPLCGSGTTPKMALLLQRRFLGIECVPKFVRIARVRVAEAAKSIVAGNGDVTAEV